MAKQRKQSSKSSEGSKPRKTEAIVDWSKDTSEGGGRRRFPEGDYKAKITKTSTGKSKDKETPYVQLSLQIVEGKYKGETITDRLYLTEGALFRLRSVYEALGKSVPSKKARMDFAKLHGGVLGITLGDDEYQKRIRSRVTDYIDLDTLAGADDDEEDEDDDDTEDDDDEDEEDDDLEDMDVDDDL